MNQLERLTQLITQAYAQGITNAVDLAQYLINNGVCDNTDLQKKIILSNFLFRRRN